MLCVRSLKSPTAKHGSIVSFFGINGLFIANSALIENVSFLRDLVELFIGLKRKMCMLKDF